MRTPSRNAHWKLFLVGLIFFLPALAGWVIYNYYGYFSFKTTNLGTLIRPASHQEALAFQVPLPQKWQIIYSPTACNTDSEKLMYTLHQLRIALGKDQERVALTLLVDPACQSPLHDFRKLTFNTQEKLQLQKALGASSTADQIYLVDPNGNVFMTYPATTNAMNVLKDLKKVLEVSQIG
jgi:hypothetical protein